MNVVSLVISLVNAVCVVVQEDVVVVVPLDIAEVLVMVAGDVIFLAIYFFNVILYNMFLLVVDIYWPAQSKVCLSRMESRKSVLLCPITEKSFNILITLKQELQSPRSFA